MPQAPAASTTTATPAATATPTPQGLTLGGEWTALGVGELACELSALPVPAAATVAEAGAVTRFDTTGAWVLDSLRRRWQAAGVALELHGVQPAAAALLERAAARAAELQSHPPPEPAVAPGRLERIGRGVANGAGEALALLSFIGETAWALAGGIRHPRRLRGRAMLANLQSAGVDALPIVGLLALLLGVVVAYQGADTLRQFGGNIFVVDLIGVSMLREFAPLIAAIIVAGRSGSAWAAQIGTMQVTEEIDAMRTLGIDPLQMLVLPKVLALVIALPLLTVFADILGVFGGMLMARSQLGVGFAEFIERFVKAVGTTTYGVGIGKAPVFAAVIATVGCFQGLRTRGGADAVGRQTTRAVVQSIFLVIVVDAIFSVVFSALDI